MNPPFTILRVPRPAYDAVRKAIEDVDAKLAGTGLDTYVSDFTLDLGDGTELIRFPRSEVALGRDDEK